MRKSKTKFLITLLIVVSVLLAATSFVSAAYGDRVLRLGTRGEDVRQLQTNLKILGYQPGPTDGIFGPRTLRAVTSFQSDYGLAVDGIVGRQTFGAIWRALSKLQPEVSRDRRNILSGKVIVLDPGHGGPDNPGAIGPSGTHEADNVLAIALMVKRLLEGSGAKVILTRTTDRAPYSPLNPDAGQLEARTLIANSSGASLFISIHNNWYDDPTVSGIMAFYHPSRDSNRRLAAALLDNLVGTAGLPNKGLETASFYVLRNTSMSSALVEVGFISNWNDEKLLQADSFRQKVAWGIYQGVLQFYGLK